MCTLHSNGVHNYSPRKLVVLVNTKLQSRNHNTKLLN